MAWFKFGKQDDSVKTQQGPTESVDAMRRRALFRLVGSVVLVLAGVVGFPMLFDSQPRSVPVDIPIDIPDKAKAKPLQLPSGTPMTTPAPAAKVDDAASLSGKEEIITNTPSVAKTPDKKPEVQANTAQTAIKSVATGAAVAGAAAVAAAAISNADKAKADKAIADKAAADKAAKIKADKEKADRAKADSADKTDDDKASNDAAVKAEKEKTEKTAKDKAAKEKQAKDKAALEASRAKSLLDGKPSDAKPAATASAAAPAVAGAERFIVQFGAFTDVAKSREVRQKVEKAGLKTYSQVAKTADGDLIRVRVGPFTSKAEADKAAAKIKALGLPASILTL